jgi:aminoglycoside 6'-N-acetyltransferase I
VKIVDLRLDDANTVQQVAALLVEAFARILDFVKTLDAALSEVKASFAPRCLSRVALDDHGDAVGWVGGIEQYDGTVYELHPLAVKPSAQRRGIGRELVCDLEEQAGQRGAMTVMLGTDDEIGGTTLYGVDVYPDVCAHIAAIRNIANHPYEFYQKCGYVIVGLVPDANGFGKPDILMARRVGGVER